MPLGRSLAAAALPLMICAPALNGQDFLFGSPVAQVTVRGGPVLHRANGDLFDFFTRELTLERGDFRAPALSGEFSIVAHPRVDLVLGLAHSEVRTRSEFRDWVDQDDLPIEQWTTLRTTPVSLSLRVYPLARGEAISRLAWVPARLTPYVGAGVGATWYHLLQEGDFIDMEDLSVFGDAFESRGQGRTGHVVAGASYWMTAKWGFNLDVRYTMGTAPLQDDFGDLREVDLSGAQAGLGLTLRW